MRPHAPIWEQHKSFREKGYTCLACMIGVNIIYRCGVPYCGTWVCGSCKGINDFHLSIIIIGVVL